MSGRIGLHIAGEWLREASRPGFSVENPATEEIVFEAVQATEEDTRSAIEAAATAFTSWRSTDPWERSATLRRVVVKLRDRMPAIARLITLETGKPLRQAMGEVATAAEYFDWFADEARRIRGETLEPRSRNTRLGVDFEPVGVAAVLTSWNFPVNLPARKIAAALAAGCTVICRPSEEAPASTAALFECLAEAGLPAGAANLLLGDHAPIVPALMADPRIRKISFTGSAEVGRSLMRGAAETLKKVSLELGGHASAIVFADADLDKAVGDLVSFKFRNAGQICISPSRFFVHDSLHDRFLVKTKSAIEALRLGNGLDEATDIGPLINRRRLEAIEGLVATSRDSGARVVSGGRRPKEPNRGYFFEPTLLAEVPEAAQIMSQEPFGPIIPLNRFDSTDDVLARANALPFGLANYVYTCSLSTAHDAISRLESGMVGVNNAAVATVEAPFGGVKQSGFGSEGGSMGIGEYLVPKFSKLNLTGLN
jgi:succinate-semialdehyde dehydrogenase / glutarate-semialdehyde dehydrogenase